MLIGGLQSTESTTYYRVSSRVLLCLPGVLALILCLALESQEGSSCLRKGSLGFPLVFVPLHT